MKISIKLPEDLVQRAKMAASESDMTLVEFIETALRVSLVERQDGKPGREFRVNASGSGGLLPGVNLDDTSALLDIMDPPEEIRKKLIG
jgi:hypothetical protein